MKRKVDVTLLGQQFAVRSDRDEAYVHALANFVGKKFEEMKRQARAASAQQLTLLVALNLADELFQTVERQAASRLEVRRRTEALVEKLNAAMADPTFQETFSAADDITDAADGDDDGAGSNGVSAEGSGGGFVDEAAPAVAYRKA
jgi:cell division protein ZapA (FtsZ GTPase activity inhibitor)